MGRRPSDGGGGVRCRLDARRGFLENRFDKPLLVGIFHGVYIFDKTDKPFRLDVDGAPGAEEEKENREAQRAHMIMNGDQCYKGRQEETDGTVDPMTYSGRQSRGDGARK